jgi:hypothetical protein
MVICDQVNHRILDICLFKTTKVKRNPYYKRYNFELDKWHWDMLVSGFDTEVENSLLRQKEIDQDLWVIEVEDRDGRHLLAEDGLSG